MAKLYAKNFANPILTLSLCFLLTKAFTLVALKNILAHTIPVTPHSIFLHTHQKRTISPAFSWTLPLKFISQQLTTSHLVSNKHNGTISPLWKQNNNIMRIITILVNIYWALTLYQTCVEHFTCIISFNLITTSWSV